MRKLRDFSCMIEKVIENVAIQFPYEPYACQVAYMQKVLQALDMKCDAALESPTGTGKTLSLLCSTLAWIQNQKMRQNPTLNQMLPNTGEKSSFVPKVYYCSRTHSQLAQVARELNKTVYKIMPTAFLASRDQLCIHDRVKKERDNGIKSAMCRSLVSKRTCHYYNKWDQANHDQLKTMYENEGNVPDIEELITIAKQHSHCPYYRSRQMEESAELVLLPYNYIISPELRRRNNVNLQGSIIIFDEAHNLESICEECVSVDLTTTDLAMATRELTKAIEIEQERTELVRADLDKGDQAFATGLIEKTKKKEEMPFDIGTAAFVLKNMYDLEKLIEEVYSSKHADCKTFMEFPGKVYPGDFLNEMLEKVGFNYDKAAQIQTLMAKAADILSEESETTGVGIGEKGVYLQKFSKFVEVVFCSRTPEAGTTNKDGPSSADFKLYMVKEKKKEGKEEEDDQKITLNYWCFSATLSMRQLKNLGARTIIVTSGTLAPLPHFMNNIGLDFGCTLENEHAASSNQVFAGIIKHGPEVPGSGSRETLNGKFNNRSNPRYHLAVGESIVKLAETVPQGILVFFSSYSLMNQMLEHFKKRQFNQFSSVWERLQKAKTVVVEPQKKSELTATRIEFQQSILTEKGGIFFAVCRGKVSEGIDFADAASRAVVIVGIPYPPIQDPRVRLKRLYLDEKKMSKPENMGSEVWYATEGFRAVNQALGRVLRHIDDFGVVAFLDSRFLHTQLDNFPSWLRTSINKFNDFDKFIDDTRNFFVDRGAAIRSSKTKLLDAVLASQGRVQAKRRERIQIQIETNFTFERPAPTVPKEVVQLATSLEALQDSETSVKKESTTKTLVSSSFGEIAIESRVQQPPRKKIKLKRNQALGAFLSDTKENPEPSPPPVTVSKLPKVEDVVQSAKMTIPDNYRQAMDVDINGYKQLMKASGKGAQMLALLKEYKTKAITLDTFIQRAVRMLLPQHSRLFIALGRIINSEDGQKVLEYAVQNRILDQ